MTGKPRSMDGKDKFTGRAGGSILEDRNIAMGVGGILTLALILTLIFLWEKGFSREIQSGADVIAQVQEQRGSVLDPTDIPTRQVYRKKVNRNRTVGGDKSYDELQQEIVRFFHYLDQREYIKAYGLPEGSYKHFLKALANLSANTPMVTGELQDYARLKQSLDHMNRTLGKDIVLLDQFLLNETETLEPTMALLYDWLTKGIEMNNGEIKMTGKELYEYAGFFINTLGGKTFLWNRDSKARILLTYYSILIVDKANREKNNRHGVDIRPALSLLINDMMNYKNLTTKGECLKKLKSIEDQYPQGK
jgi:hypothetical protein